MPNPIMPYGYSMEQTRKRVEEKLRLEHAQDLAAATVEERIRIEKKIKDEIKQRIEKLYPHTAGHSHVLW